MAGHALVLRRDGGLSLDRLLFDLAQFLTIIVVHFIGSKRGGFGHVGAALGQFIDVLIKAPGHLFQVPGQILGHRLAARGKRGLAFIGALGDGVQPVFEMLADTVGPSLGLVLHAAGALG